MGTHDYLRLLAFICGLIKKSAAVLRMLPVGVFQDLAGNKIVDRFDVVTPETPKAGFILQNL